ncbi:LLM class flavin-dependent oxidoreductase [Pseudonocardia sp. GCM10023141]|uniref:LLM class flavin-dependent oxidoreductase n=1 Tax=Pseudonocardia sp. GCM10023141 TaxID=3252653 RepID=UPI00360ECF1C
MPVLRLGLNTSDMDTVVADAQAAEAAGFDYLGCGEHLFFHGTMPNAFITLAAAAGATSSIRLVSTITLLPLYSAAMAAKLAASVDRVSGGRFELGVGAGGEYPPEFAAAGVDPATRFRRMDEGLSVIRQLFRGEPTSFAGEFTTLDGVTLDPPPVHPGGPAIWLGGRKDGALRRAGRFADVWMPYMVDPVRLDAGLVQVRDAAEASGRRREDVAGAVFLWTCVDPDEAWARGTGVAAVSATYAQDFAPLADRYLALGTPDRVAARIAEFAEAGATRVILQVAAGPADRRRAVGTISDELLPRVRALTAPGAAA